MQGSKAALWGAWMGVVFAVAACGGSERSGLGIAGGTGASDGGPSSGGGAPSKDAGTASTGGTANTGGAANTGGQVTQKPCSSRADCRPNELCLGPEKLECVPRECSGDGDCAAESYCFRGACVPRLAQ